VKKTNNKFDVVSIEWEMIFNYMQNFINYFLRKWLSTVGWTSLQFTTTDYLSIPKSTLTGMLGAVSIIAVELFTQNSLSKITWNYRLLIHL